MTEIQGIIEGCKKNRCEAQEKLYDLLASKLFYVCLRYSRDREEAKDLVQESFIKIFQHIASFSGEGSFEGWCKRICINTCLSYIRSRFFQFSSEMEEAEKMENKVSVQYSNDLELNELLNMISKLTTQKKVIFTLYEIEGYSHSEIGEMLHITEGASRGQLAKAKEDLRQLHQKNNRIAELKNQWMPDLSPLQKGGLKPLPFGERFGEGLTTNEWKSCQKISTK